MRITGSLVSNVLLNMDPMILIRETCGLNSSLDFEARPPGELGGLYYPHYVAAASRPDRRSCRSATAS